MWEKTEMQIHQPWIMVEKS